jgi:membrane-associated protein
MPYGELQSVAGALQLLAHHQTIAYPILFIGALVETLIPFSLIIYGEFFFLSGSILAAVGILDIWAVTAALYAGGILGDNCSYWLGRNYGVRIFDRFSNWPLLSRGLSQKVQKKGIAFFQDHGDLAVLLARLSGPFSWITPTLAGMYRQPYKRFVIFNALGVVMGIGEFLIIGYLLGNSLDSITTLLAHLEYLPLVSIIGLIPLLLWIRYKKFSNTNH